MNYKIIEREKDVYFKYSPKKIFKKINKEVSKTKKSPFDVLKNLNLN